jgi:hypothetical protein
MKLGGENRSTGGKTCPSATLSSTNPTLTENTVVTACYNYTQSHIVLVTVVTVQKVILFNYGLL